MNYFDMYAHLKTTKIIDIKVMEEILREKFKNYV